MKLLQYSDGGRTRVARVEDKDAVLPLAGAEARFHEHGQCGAELDRIDPEVVRQEVHLGELVGIAEAAVGAGRW